MNADAKRHWQKAIGHWGRALRRRQLSTAQLLALALVAADTWPQAQLQVLLPRWLRLSCCNQAQRRLVAMEAARLFKQQRQPQLSLACLRALAEQATADADHQLLQGELERLCGHHQQAEQLLHAVLEQPAMEAAATYQLGELERSRGDFEQAAHWLLRSLGSDPLNRHTHNALHYTRFRNSAVLEQVIAAYEQLCQQHPGNGLIHHLHSHYLLRSGAVDASAAVAQQAARLELGERSRQLAPPEAEPTPPDFLVIGVPKGGTSSLLAWLGHHPQLWVHPRKELHFFDIGWQHGSRWYQHQFPRFQSGSGLLRGEATPNYFQLPECPQRVHSLMPNAKLILLLRDPLQRALSWIAHLKRHEGLQGETDGLLLQELQQLKQLSAEELAHSSCRWPDALLGSCYDLHLRRWQQWFAPEQMLLLPSESLFEQPQRTLQTVAHFLGVAETWPMGQLRPYNQAPQGAHGLSQTTAETLQRFLNEHSNRACQQAAATISQQKRSPL